MVVVGIHEASHCFAAKLVGVKVLRFSIGFGKSLFSIRDKSGTEYCFALIPLGGYVNMLGESEEALNETDIKKSYGAQPFYKKAFIIAAGPLSNFVIAFLLYTFVYCMGFTTIKPIIGKLAPQSIAAKAALLPYTEIVEIDHVKTASWTKVVFQLVLHAGQRDTVQIKTKKVCGLVETPLSHCKSETSTHLLNLATFKLNSLKPDPLDSLGIAPYVPQGALPTVMLQKIQYAPLAAIYHAYLQCKELTYFNLVVLKKMLVGTLSLDSLGGPIAIIDTAGEALNQGALVFVVFLAFMNLSIGLINLFPIPGLDGGHLLLQSIEALIRRPIPPIMIEWALRVGFALLFFIFLRALFNDIMRFF